ncbi:MAG: amidase family protein, partial [Burkholderiaceae bacterium]
MIDDPVACLGEIARGASSAATQIERSLDGAATCSQTFLKIDSAGARATGWALHRERLATSGARYDPRVALRMRRGAASSAADYRDLQRARAAWIGRMARALRGFGAVLSPVVPIVAPPIAALEASDEAFFRVHALLLHNPSIVNLLDGCAITLPCNEAGRAPVGLMLWAGAHADST